MILCSNKKLGITLSFHESSSGDGPIHIAFSTKMPGIVPTIIISGGAFHSFRNFCRTLALTNNTKYLRSRKVTAENARCAKMFKLDYKYVPYYAGVDLRHKPEVIIGLLPAECCTRFVRQTGFSESINVGGELHDDKPLKTSEHTFYATMSPGAFGEFKRLCFRALRKLETMGVPHKKSSEGTRRGQSD